jgi:rubredoxin
MTSAFVTVTTFDNSIDAHIAKTKLESQGIDCYLFDENIVALNPYYNLTVGGIKLRVRSADQEKAVAILNEVEDTPYTDEKDNVIKCPICQSEKIYHGFTSANSLRTVSGLLISVFTLMFPFVETVYPLVMEKKYHCKMCDFEFERTIS